MSDQPEVECDVFRRFAEHAPGQRGELVARWRELLRPGGQIVLAQRFRPGSSQAVVRFTPEQTQSLVNAVRREAGRRRHELGVDPDELAEAAEAYARKFFGHAVRSRPEVEALFAEGGFSLEEVDVHTHASPADGGVSGPTLSAAAQSLWLIARRDG